MLPLLKELHIIFVSQVAFVEGAAYYSSVGESLALGLECRIHGKCCSVPYSSRTVLPY